MVKILLRPEAERDLDEIWWYIAQDSPASADKLLDEIEETSRKLGRFKNMGRDRDDLYPGLQSFPVGKYLIFYMPISGGIEIIRVLHGMMDIDAFFF
ncbi:type II toxin-antitoxin system RelE/ParE family toxin [Geobacter sp.]|uniref:type II toxin-antitoxin system RelE/ParE family toxin n=1 Tax=Geobacter sp. TaxID=46610 RepID=UPI001AC0C46D|nr:type II toxin-antitoxin system RelE/ParE family toxin [Geobacter sp.]CAG0997850.1 Toxin ParE1 [Anaerolineales bacterium]